MVNPYELGTKWANHSNSVPDISRQNLELSVWTPGELLLATVDESKLDGFWWSPIA